MAPARSCKSRIVWIEMFTVHRCSQLLSIIPAARNKVRLRNDGVRPSDLRSFEALCDKNVKHNHRYKSKRMNRPWFYSTSRYIRISDIYESHWKEHPIDKRRSRTWSVVGRWASDMCLPLAGHRWRFTRDKFETRTGNGFTKQDLGLLVINADIAWIWSSGWIPDTKKYDKYWCLEVLLCINLGAWVYQVIMGTRIDVPWVLAHASCVLASCCFNYTTVDAHSWRMDHGWIYVMYIMLLSSYWTW